LAGGVVFAVNGLLVDSKSDPESVNMDCTTVSWKNKGQIHNVKVRYCLVIVQRVQYMLAMELK
jgi:hypothetical protein